MVWQRFDNLGSFRNFLSVVLLSAPDDFMEEDYLGPEDQLDLDKAFAEIRRGLELLREKRGNKVNMEELEQMVEDCHRLYREGDDMRAAHLLQEFEEKVFGQ